MCTNIKFSSINNAEIRPTNSIEIKAYIGLILLFGEISEIWTPKNNIEAKNEENIGQKMIVELSKYFFQTYLHIAMDNYFTSIPLFQILYENKLTLTGLN